MYYTKEQRDKALNMILSPKGREWLAKRRVSQKVVDEALHGIERGGMEATLSELVFNCGGLELEVGGTTTSLILGVILYSIAVNTPMLVATAIKRQEKEAAIFKKLGFKQGPWVTRGRHGNEMCFLTLALDGSLSGFYDRRWGELENVLNPNKKTKGPIW